MRRFFPIGCLPRNKPFIRSLLAAGVLSLVILGFLQFFPTNKHGYLGNQVVFSLTKNQVDRSVPKPNYVSNEDNTNRDTKVTQKQTKTEISEDKNYDAEQNNDHKNQHTQLNFDQKYQNVQLNNYHKDQDAQLKKNNKNQDVQLNNSHKNQFAQRNTYRNNQGAQPNNIYKDEGGQRNIVHEAKNRQRNIGHKDQDGQRNNGHKDQDARQSDSQKNQDPPRSIVNYLSAGISNEQNETVCKDNKRHVSFSESLQCFRKAVTVITELMEEYEPKLTGVANVPQHYFEPRKKVIQQLVEDYPITPSASFQRNCPYLLALQMSILDRWSDRDAVRSTWASVVKEQKWPNRQVNAVVKILFVVADLEDNKQQDFKKIQEEASEHDDILYIAMQDSYRNLTQKVVSSFKWVTDFCPCVKFVLKVDTDTFVNVPLLVDTLMANEEKFDYAIGGTVLPRPHSVVRRNKNRWAVSEKLYPMSDFPDYTSGKLTLSIKSVAPRVIESDVWQPEVWKKRVEGCSYFLSKKVVAKVAEVAPYIPMLPIEDAYITGVLRLVIQCKMFSFKSYFPKLLDIKWPLCDIFHDKKIAGTGVDRIKRQLIWETFLNNGTTC